MDDFYRIKRLPPYVFAVVNDLKTKARARGEDIIDLGMGNPDLPTPKHIVAKLVEAAQNPKNHRYSASRGITRLRVAITRWYRERYGVMLDAENPHQLFVPIGFAHGFCVVSETADVLYKVSSPYVGATECGIAFDDPEIAVCEGHGHGLWLRDDAHMPEVAIAKRSKPGCPA